MSTATKVVLACAATAVVVGVGVASWFMHEPGLVREEVTPVRSVTVTLSVTGDATTRVEYTCADGSGVVDTCGPEPVPVRDVWSKRVSVPAGTTVRVQARGGVVPALCEISDASDRAVLVHGERGVCETVVR